MGLFGKKKVIPVNEPKADTPASAKKAAKDLEKPAKKPNGKNVRDSGSGKFVKGSEAKKRPATTVSEPRAKKAAKKECPDCNGRGLNLTDYNKLCPNCEGSGRV